MISAVCWVPKGASRTVPAAAQLPSKEDIEELERSNASHQRDIEREDDEGMDVDDTDAENEDAVGHALAAAKALQDKCSSSAGDLAFVLQELDMDHYDDEDDDGIELFSKGMGDLYYASNKMDPYLINKDDDDDDDEEIEDMTIKPTDAVIVCARTEGEASQLEVMILEESEDGDSSMFVHHEIILSSFPLCTAWLDLKLNSGDKGNFIAVGSMEPEIEIWDLDVLEEVKPVMVLGGTKKRKGKKASVPSNKGGHTDSVLGLAWNKEVRNVLASGSGDKSVKVWDLNHEKCAATMKHHTDKVQAVSWNKHSPEMLLSGSFDKTVVLMDVRPNAHVGNKWTVPADVECLAWNPLTEYSFVVSLDNGMVQGFDIRAASSDSSGGCKPSFTLHAHEKPVSSISYNPVAPNLLATGSTDKMVKLWDISNDHPTCVASRNPKLGAIFSLSFSEDSPSLLASGGSKGKIEVWDTLCDPGVELHYGKYIKQRR